MEMSSEERLRRAKKVIAGLGEDTADEYERILRNLSSLIDVVVFTGIADGERPSRAVARVVTACVSIALRDPKWGAQLAVLAEIAPGYDKWVEQAREDLDLR